MLVVLARSRSRSRSLSRLSLAERGFEKSARRTIGACLTGDNKTVLCVFIANAKGMSEYSAVRAWPVLVHVVAPIIEMVLLLPWSCVLS